ncbi:alpha/beta hydrolase [Hymenobacter jeollabukensis]|uniref:Alpha/beta hydrolase n=1 Tax=Hymenobacter jeollabukensis TaxID=2025313 RepID=A0A5R8WQW8_9BACT|nr:alpha/beta hydrolase [Hymenobacter jeollabukensis]TLM93154.1 alpha/beta hydrolase [Hymenobacter jeollabukensis]
MRQLVVSLFVLLISTSSLSAQTVEPLYSGTIPNSKPSEVKETSVTLANGGVRVSNVVQPTLSVFRAPKDKANGTAVIVCPGGGYARLSIDHEGYDVARRLNELGITAFVLKYRLPNDQSQPDKTTAPLLDAQQALRLVRQRAKEYGIDPARVGILGFSAGGHLASTAGTHFAQPPGDDKSGTSVRPDFLVLLYPVISFSDSLMHVGSRTNLLGANPAAEQVRLYSNELQVTAQTPPTFLVHAQDDKTVKVQNSLRFYEACLHHHVPVEMHLYPQGGHGFGLNNKTTKDQWFERLQNWLDAGGWLRR